LPALALLCALGFVATFLVALHTGRGVRVDDALFRHVHGNAAIPPRAAGTARELLLGVDVVFVVVALLSLFALAALRNRVGRALAAVAVVFCSVASVEALKYGLPHVDSLIPAGRPSSMPSGHTSIAASLGLAFVLVAPPILRPAAALAGAAYTASVGLSLVLLGWHYPADVVAALFVCGFWAAAIASVIGDTVARPNVSAPGALVATVATAVALALAALIASRHPAGAVALRSARSVVATAAALGSLTLALFGSFMLLVGERPE
jgi:membrane-associated phospholipid phosphatase